MLHCKYNTEAKLSLQAQLRAFWNGYYPEEFKKPISLEPCFHL